MKRHLWKSHLEVERMEVQGLIRLAWFVAAVAAILVIFGMWAAVRAGDPIPPNPKPEGAAAVMVVVSPAEGVFFAGEYPGGAPLVNKGDRVTPDTLVGIVDGMYATCSEQSLAPRFVGSRQSLAPCFVGSRQSLAPVRVMALATGTIGEIFVRDGQMVRVGEPLMTIVVGNPAG